MLAFQIRNSGTVARFSNSKFRYSCALFKFEIRTVSRFSNSKFRYSFAHFKFEIQVQLHAFHIRNSPLYIFTFRNQECCITRPHNAYKCRLHTFVCPLSKPYYSQEKILKNPRNLILDFCSFQFKLAFR